MGHIDAGPRLARGTAHPRRAVRSAWFASGRPGAACPRAARGRSGDRRLRRGHLVRPGSRSVLLRNSASAIRVRRAGAAPRSSARRPVVIAVLLLEKMGGADRGIDPVQVTRAISRWRRCRWRNSARMTDTDAARARSIFPPPPRRRPISRHRAIRRRCRPMARASSNHIDMPAVACIEADASNFGHGSADGCRRQDARRENPRRHGRRGFDVRRTPRGSPGRGRARCRGSSRSRRPPANCRRC